MKNLRSTTEGTWVEIKPVILTEEQETLMVSLNESDREAKIALIEEVKSKREVVAKKADKKLAISKYNEVKPALEETDVYELIAMDIVVSEKSTTGILNCRVNGEHKQIRFSDLTKDETYSAPILVEVPTDISVVEEVSTPTL